MTHKKKKKTKLLALRLRTAEARVRPLQFQAKSFIAVEVAQKGSPPNHH